MTNPKTISPGLERAARALKPHAFEANFRPHFANQWRQDRVREDAIRSARAALATLLDPGSDVLSAAIAACRDTGQTGFDFKTVSKAVIVSAIKNILGEDA